MCLWVAFLLIPACWTLEFRSPSPKNRLVFVMGLCCRYSYLSRKYLNRQPLFAPCDNMCLRYRIVLTPAGWTTEFWFSVVKNSTISLAILVLICNYHIRKNLNNQPLVPPKKICSACTYHSDKHPSLQPLTDPHEQVVYGVGFCLNQPPTMEQVHILFSFRGKEHQHFLKQRVVFSVHIIIVSIIRAIIDYLMCQHSSWSRILSE